MDHRALSSIVIYKTYAELRAEAARSYLGVLWWVLEPLLYMAAFYLIFSHLRQERGADFVAYLLIGLTVWKGFAGAVQLGAGSIQANAPLMRQVYLPKQVFPLIASLTSGFKFLVVLALLCLTLPLLGVAPDAHWLALPLLVVIEFLLGLGLALLLAGLLPLLPDIKLLLDNALLLLFFLSGIFFDLRGLPAPIQEWLWLNPMAVLIEAYRDVLLRAQWPDWSALAAITLLALLLLLAGHRLIRRLDRRYPKLING